MNLSQYQQMASRTQNTKLSPDMRIMVSALGLVGEAGEVANAIKKFVGHGHTEQEIKQRIQDETGDVLWYLADIATAFGLDLAVIAEENIGKLKRRYPQGFSEHDSRSRAE